MNPTPPDAWPEAVPPSPDALQAGLSRLQQAPLAAELIAWQARHGRHDLPWQATRDPYRVWLSELMLQQTQVKTVLGYYDRFLARFPDVQRLAAASQDEVFALWSGLGYYARARNLHACAQAVVAQHGGVFPRTAQALCTLPGIGPSTAAAIASFCFGERVAIFDGNVKRVLARVLGFDEDLAASRAAKRLQTLAQAALPPAAADMPAYTQAIMDLGATVCTPRKPRCEACPFQTHCQARLQGTQAELPRLTRKLKRTAEAWQMLVAQAPDGRVWLERRPSRGVWAGLHAWPLVAEDKPVQAAGAVVEPGEVFKHVLTHKDLYLRPVWLRFAKPAAADRWAQQQPDGGQWWTPEQAAALGLPKPVRDVLEAGVAPRLL
ncbi:A/G-specific adenine glycosylase [Comamonas serinivorans]|uniref:Adenine DNA glycosylase n=1 Tax=Comamonas serinivorans TaxID=1082851 RepID=A0A1Y0EQW6_9BURK|nr:A/G-specific adenine glycosylase [Comamonas serinivorans]ARU06054.1 A/G-specific adenine glycosylase [Comamonas serinivorans]